MGTALVPHMSLANAPLCSRAILKHRIARQLSGAASGTIPVIDVAPLRHHRATGNGQAAAEAVAHELHNACSDIGFFAVTGHGIPVGLQARVLDTARHFFDLPQEEKDKICLNI